jgi:hypothetical protein
LLDLLSIELIEILGMSETDSLQEYFEQRKAEHITKVKTQEELVASPAYQSELKFIERITSDIIMLLRLCLTYSGRAGEYSENSLTIRSTDDLAQSVLATWHLVQQGMINPVKRELRYIIESSVKYLYVDQHAKGMESLAKLPERLAFLETNVNSSIDVREELKLAALHPDDAKQFVDELYDIYRDCCAYVHVSRRQIEERLDMVEKGRSLGFETAEELRKIGRLMFRVYDVALTLYFHGYDLSMTGDIFIEALDDLSKWKFHKGKYVSVVSGYFDYKHERNMRKYGESRPWSPEGWPPKRL